MSLINNDVKKNAFVWFNKIDIIFMCEINDSSDVEYVYKWLLKNGKHLDKDDEDCVDYSITKKYWSLHLELKFKNEKFNDGMQELCGSYGQKFVVYVDKEGFMHYKILEQLKNESEE